MRIGILSDSHGRTGNLERALAVLDAVGVDLIVHCGDVGGAEVFDVLAGRPVRFVWGNTDLPDEASLAAVERAGLEPPTTVPLRLDVDGRRLAVFHGHEPAFRPWARAIGAGGEAPEDLDYVLFGHTHQLHDARIGRTRCINPGALHRATPKSFAILDPATDTLDVRRLEPRS